VRTWIFLPIAGVLCHLLVWYGPVAGQDRDTTAAPKKGSESARDVPRLVEEGPRFYYFKDKDGKLVLVPGITYQDIKDAHDRKIGAIQRNRRPEHVLQRMMIHGSVKGDHAEVTVDLAVQLRDEGWVQVPLHFDQVVLLEMHYKGPGEQILSFEPKGDGHVTWIRGPANGQHNLTLKMLVPVSQVGGCHRLQLSLPRATTSELKLQVPVAKAVGKISKGATLLPPAERGKDTEFRVLGLAGNFELAWHKPDGRVAKVQTVLEVEGTILTRIEDRGIETSATLRVESYGAPFDRFQVRLPPGAELTPGNPSDYTLAPIESREKTTPPQRIVEVRLAQKTSGPVEVHLATRRLRNKAKQKESFELAGFEVAGAARQSGHVAVAVESDGQVIWGDDIRGVRQVDQLPEALRHKDVYAGFEYFVQPYSLTVELAPKKTPNRVEPEYLLLVDKNQVRLRAKLKYTVRGAKESKLYVALPRIEALPDWELDEVGPENLVTVAGVSVDETNEFRMVTIPLQQLSGGQIEVEIQAHRPIEEGTRSLVLPLPQPRECSLGAATVVVMPADNVQLVPNGQLTKGLIRQGVAPQMELPKRQQSPLFYRGETMEAVFAGDFEILAQRVDVEVKSRVRVERLSVSVQQDLAYTIAHEPVDVLTMNVPRSIADLGQLEILYNGKPITPVALNESGVSKQKPEQVPMRILLPESCIGSCEISVRYTVAAAKLQPGNPVTVSVPLVTPREGTLTGNEVRVTSSRDVEVEPDGDAWVALESSGAANDLLMSSDQLANRIDLTVKLENVDDAGTTVVERAWIQTWLTHSERLDRSVFVFTSDRDQIGLVIPTGADVNATQVLLDGVPLAARVDETGRLVIPLSNGTGPRRRRLEVHTRFPSEPRRPGRMSIELAHLEPDVWTRRVYWQLVLPKNEHVVAIPEGFTGEFRWAWDEYFWGRKPLLEQPQLESWVGTSAEAPVAKSANRYLFSGVGEVEQCTLRTAGRTFIVLGASGIALVVGLLLIYVPVCRHPGALFVFAIVLLGLGMFYPEATLLAAQAAGLGFALALVAWFLQRNVARHRHRIGFSESPSSILARESTQTQYQHPIASNQLPTQMGPLAVPPTSDSNT